MENLGLGLLPAVTNTAFNFPPSDVSLHGAAQSSHPSHPSHSSHPTHPSHSSHPSHPSHPMYPSHSMHPSHLSHSTHSSHNDVVISKGSSYARAEGRIPGRSSPYAVLGENHTPLLEHHSGPTRKKSRGKDRVGIPKACENCGEMHDGRYGSGRFCSQSCRSRFNGRKMTAAPSGKTRPRSGKKVGVDGEMRKPKRAAASYARMIFQEVQC